jgi:hypothetical protein
MCSTRNIITQHIYYYNKKTFNPLSKIIHLPCQYGSLKLHQEENDKTNKKQVPSSCLYLVSLSDDLEADC